MDYTEEVVLVNIIHGLYYEDIQAKVLSMEEKKCTLVKVLKLVEAEDLGIAISSN